MARLARPQASKQTSEYIRQRDGGICVYCEREPGFVVDHVMPVSRGGPNVRGNMVWSCSWCNGYKSDHLIEWMLVKAFQHLARKGESLAWADSL